VDRRTHLCFFLYMGEPASDKVPGPSGLSPIPCEALRAVPELADQLDFLNPPTAVQAAKQ
jgi:hypothetical protein